MKLKDVKDKIENYFSNADPDNLYEKALRNGFKEVKKTPLKLFEESLNKISDEDFSKLLDEMENDPEGCGITIGEFVEKFSNLK